MAVFAIKQVTELDPPAVLAPERYDPRREARFIPDRCLKNLELCSLAESIRKTFSPSTGALGRYLVLDTSDAQRGIIVSQKPPVVVGRIGSAKKVVQPRDVIVSRLRPYLRQIALVDEQIPFSNEAAGILVSTEFFVLRSRDAKSLAFLVPFLLSDSVQEILAASQEGGHHPRFPEPSLMAIPIPEALLARREEISAQVEQSVALFRDSERRLVAAIDSIERELLT